MASGKRKRTEEQNRKLIEQTKHSRIKKGEVRNPNGRPKRLPSLDRILEHVFGVDDTQEDKDSKITQIMEAMHREARKGSVAAANLVLERMAGKVAQKVNMQVGISKEDVSNLFPFQKSEDK